MPDGVAFDRAADPVVSVLLATTSLDRTLEALHAVALAAGEVPIEAIVIVNGAPEVAAALRARTTGVQVVESACNRGIAGAANLGRALARGEFLLLQHDDSLLRSGWVPTMVATAHEHPLAGVLAGTVLHPDGRLQGAGWLLFSDATSSPPWRGSPPPVSTFSSVRRIQYSSSSALLVRASHWDDIGGLDERLYPGYFVDVDLALATHRLGREVLFQPSAVSVHAAGASSAPEFRGYVAARNQRLIRDKWATDLASLPSPDPTVDLAALVATIDVLPPGSPRPVPVHGSPFDDAWYVAASAELDADFRRFQNGQAAAAPAPRLRRSVVRRLVSAARRSSPPASR